MTYLDPSVLTAGIPVAAMRADPMTTAEIDAHPDADRIWATLRAIRNLCDERYDEGYAAAEAEFDGAEEEASDGGYAAAIRDVDDNIHALLREYEGDLSEALEKRILALTPER